MIPRAARVAVCAAAMFPVIALGSANAVTLSFFNLHPDGHPDVSGQLSAKVEAVGTNKVSFTFTNDVGLRSSIGQIYFDDGPLGRLVSVTESPGVSFGTDRANPRNLPEANHATPDFDATFGFDRENSARNGINAAGEFLTILFKLAGGQTFADTITALALGDLRIGLHVQSLSDRGSDAYLNSTPAPIPLPAGLLLFLGGLAGIGLLGRMKAKWDRVNSASA